LPEWEFQLTLTQLLHPSSCSYFGKIPWTLKPTSSISSSGYSSTIRTQNTTVSNYSTIWQNVASKSHHQQQQKQGSHKLVNHLILHLLLRGQSPSTSELLGSQIERSGRATEETRTQRDSQTQQNWSPTALGSEEKNPQLHRLIDMWSWRWPQWPALSCLQATGVLLGLLTKGPLKVKDCYTTGQAHCPQNLLYGLLCKAPHVWHRITTTGQVHFQQNLLCGLCKAPCTVQASW